MSLRRRSLLGGREKAPEALCLFHFDGDFHDETGNVVLDRNISSVVTYHDGLVGSGKSICTNGVTLHGTVTLDGSDFTLECRVKAYSTDISYKFALRLQNTSITSYAIFFAFRYGKIYFSYPDGTNHFSDVDGRANTHLAAVYDSSAKTLSFYINGTLFKTVSANLPAGVYNLHINNVNNALDVDELRISPFKVWTSNFTPPTEPYTCSNQADFNEYEIQPFTIRATTSNTVVSFSSNCYYSMNGGSSWYTYNRNTSYTLGNGQTISFKGNISPQSYQGVGKISVSSGRVVAEGNIMSLLFNDDFYGRYNLSTYTTNTGAFLGLFNGCSYLTSAENLILPATTLGSFDYASMFYGCTLLTTAPLLPALEIHDTSYSMMFYNCSSLLNVRCLATSDNSGGSSGTYSWLHGVNTVGNFTKAASATFWTRGENGIPVNWNIINV